jgi:hypothetical protein
VCQRFSPHAGDETGIYQYRLCMVAFFSLFLRAKDFHHMLVMIQAFINTLCAW